MDEVTQAIIDEIELHKRFLLGTWRQRSPATTRQASAAAPHLQQQKPHPATPPSQREFHTNPENWLD
jgi:hypothetical protein